MGTMDPGDCVEVRGLSSKIGQELSGQKGVLAARVEETDRFEVRLLPERVISLRLESIKKLRKEEVLLSIQEQLLETVSLPDIAAQITEFRSSAKSMRKFGQELQK